MIRRLSRSKADIENLSRLRTAFSGGENNFSYKGVIVNKPWGYEYLMFENSEVAIWILYLNYGHKTSMHCHPSKKSSLVILSGKIILSGLEGWFELSDGQAASIDEAVFHSSESVSKDGAFLMEIETPPNKHDLVRLKDEYGREKQGYEGEDRITRELHKYKYVDFHHQSAKNIKKNIGNCSISVCSFENIEDIGGVLKRESGHLICLLHGNLHDAQGLLLAAGEVGLLSEVKSRPAVFAQSDIMYLTILLNGGKRKS